LCAIFGTDCGKYGIFLTFTVGKKNLSIFFHFSFFRHQFLNGRHGGYRQRTEAKKVSKYRGRSYLSNDTLLVSLPQTVRLLDIAKVSQVLAAITINIL